MAKIKQATLDAVAQENEYQRAIARWIATHLYGRPADEQKIYAVDFFLEEGWGNDCCCGNCWNSMAEGASWGLRFQFDGHTSEVNLTYVTTAGKFVEECVALLDKSS